MEEMEEPMEEMEEPIEVEASHPFNIVDPNRYLLGWSQILLEHSTKASTGMVTNSIQHS